MKISFKAIHFLKKKFSGNIKSFSISFSIKFSDVQQMDCEDAGVINPPEETAGPPPPHNGKYILLIVSTLYVYSKKMKHCPFNFYF